MPSPFPGMNPYLENPEIWPAVHSRLIVAIADALVPQIRPNYLVDIEKRIYQSSGETTLLVGIPDVTVRREAPLSRRESLPSQTNPSTSNVAVAAPPVTPVQVRMPMPEEVREAYLEVRDTTTGEVVTVIEVLSPANKRPGKGREMYLEKRETVVGSRTHLVEIDLLRKGEPMPFFGTEFQGNYRILVSRGDRRPTADLYLFNLPQPIPTFTLPLRSQDAEPTLDLQALLNSLYDRAGYDYTLDYSAEPVPPLEESETAWADALLREQQLR